LARKKDTNKSSKRVFLRGKREGDPSLEGGGKSLSKTFCKKRESGRGGVEQQERRGFPQKKKHPSKGGGETKCLEITPRGGDQGKDSLRKLGGHSVLCRLGKPMPGSKGSGKLGRGETPDLEKHPIKGTNKGTKGEYGKKTKKLGWRVIIKQDGKKSKFGPLLKK